MNLTGQAPRQKAPKVRRNTKAGREYMNRVKQLPCVICQAPPPSDAHHVFHDRFGTLKADDFMTVPLCKIHHQDGPDAIHNIKATWRERHGPDYSYIPLVRAQLSDLEIDF